MSRISLRIPFVLLFTLCLSCIARAQVCNIHCDGRDKNLAVNPRSPVSVELFGRKISLHISDSDNMAFAIIENGDPSDEVWLDRSFDGGVSWQGRLGYVVIPSGSRQWATLMYNVDNPSNTQHIGIGALRSCGKANNRDDIACTDWARSTVNADTPIDAAATALMQFYDDRGLWKTTGWWNAANCLTAIIDYMKITGKATYRYVIDTTFEKNKNMEDGNFTNMYIGNNLRILVITAENSFRYLVDKNFINQSVDCLTPK